MFHRRLFIAGPAVQLKFEALKKLYGKEQTGLYEVSCNLRVLKQQYRDPIVVVGIPKTGVEIRTWTGEVALSHVGQ